MEGLSTYFDFAENDFLYLSASMEHKMIYNGMTALAQNICEKYLKHIIDEYYEPKKEEEFMVKQDILRTHSLKKLIGFLDSRMGIELSDEKYDGIIEADGYYFSARYPGESSFMVNERDVNRAYNAVKVCRDFVLAIIRKMKDGD